MSDSRLRELERRAAAGDAEAGGRLLLERVRAGGLQREQLELLAYLQHPVAWLALGWTLDSHMHGASEPGHAALFRTPALEQRLAAGEVLAAGDLYAVPLRLKPWALGLVRWGREACLRAAIAAARYKHVDWLQRYERVQDDDGGVVVQLSRMIGPGAEEARAQHDRRLRAELKDSVTLCITAAEWCVLVDSVPRRNAAGGRLSQARQLWNVNNLTQEGTGILPQYAMCLAQYAYAGKADAKWAAEAITGSWRDVAFQDVVPCERYEPLPNSDGQDAFIRALEEPVRHAVRDELAAWILDGHDMVRERLDDELAPYRAVLAQKKR